MARSDGRVRIWLVSCNEDDICWEHLSVVHLNKVSDDDVGPCADDELAADETLALGRVEQVVRVRALDVLLTLEDRSEHDDADERR